MLQREPQKSEQVTGKKIITQFCSSALFTGESIVFKWSITVVPSPVMQVLCWLVDHMITICDRKNEIMDIRYWLHVLWQKDFNSHCLTNKNVDNRRKFKEDQLHCTERSHLKLLTHLIKMPPHCFPFKGCCAHPTRRWPWWRMASGFAWSNQHRISRRKWMDGQSTKSEQSLFNQASKMITPNEWSSNLSIFINGDYNLAVKTW